MKRIKKDRDHCAKFRTGEQAEEATMQFNTFFCEKDFPSWDKKRRQDYIKNMTQGTQGEKGEQRERGGSKRTEVQTACQAQALHKRRILS